LQRFRTAQKLRRGTVVSEQNLRELAVQTPGIELFSLLARALRCWVGTDAHRSLEGADPAQQTITVKKQNMKLNRSLLLASTAAFLCLGASQTSLAQQDNGGPPPGRRNFDPAQFRQRMMDNLKEQLEVTDDTEWKALEPMVQAVMDARMASMSGMGRGMFGGQRRRANPTDGGNNNSNNTGNNGDQQRRGPFGQAPSPEADALQKAIDAKAPKAEIKTALEKFVASRKAKQTDLEKAQEQLRKVLTSRQEAIATLNGLL
jgi:hypothetical protein